MRVTSTYYTILVLMLSSYTNFEYHISQKPLKCVREYFFLIIMNRGMHNFNSFKKRKNYSKRGNRKNIRRRKNMLIVKYYDAVVVFSYYIYVSVRILSCKKENKNGENRNNYTSIVRYWSLSILILVLFCNCSLFILHLR